MVSIAHVTARRRVSVNVKAGRVTWRVCCLVCRVVNLFVVEQWWRQVDGDVEDGRQIRRGVAVRLPA